MMTSLTAKPHGVEGFGASIIVKSKPIRFLEKGIVFVKP